VATAAGQNNNIPGVTVMNLYNALATAAVGDASRVLKRALEAEHGAVASHWGYTYFVLKVRVHKTLAGQLHTLVGVFSPQANNGGGGGAGIHTEQRALDQLRLFIRALEPSKLAQQGITMEVVEVHSRWLIDYTPDTDAANWNCEWALQFHRWAFGAGYFRSGEYTNAVRDLAPAQQQQGQPLPRSQAGLLAYAQAQNWVHGGVIAWNAPVFHFVYQGTTNGQTQRQNRDTARTNNIQGVQGNIPTAASETAVSEPNLQGLRTGDAIAYVIPVLN